MTMSWLDETIIIEDCTKLHNNVNNYSLN